MRLDRARLEHAVFPFRYEVGTRYSDTDSIGHINNVAILALLQEGRIRFFHTGGFLTAARVDIVVGGAYVEFAGDLRHPAPAEIFVGVLEIGRTSFRLGQIAKQAGRTAVYAEFVQVARGADGPVAIPEAWRELLERSRIVSAG